MVEGRNLAVDGTLIGASASNQSRVPRKKLAEVAQISRTVQEYLTELERQNPVADPEESRNVQEMVSSTDPDAAWAVKSGTTTLGYYDNYLVDTTSRVILSVDATPARFRQEMLAAQRMIERVSQLGVRPQNLAADKAYGSGEFLAWLLERNIQPHIPVIDRRHQTFGHFTRDQFRYAPEENAYYCPEGKPLRYSGPNRRGQTYIYSSTILQCRGCPQKDCCTTGPFRNLVVHWQEPARQIVRGLTGTTKSKLCCRAQTADKTASSPIAKTVERGRAVPPRGSSSKSKKAGKPPRSKAIASAQHLLRLAEKGSNWVCQILEGHPNRFKETLTRLYPLSILHFSTHSFVSDHALASPSGARRNRDRLPSAMRLRFRRYNVFNTTKVKSSASVVVCRNWMTEA